MKTPLRILRTIQGLRATHTEHFRNYNFVPMQSIANKIASHWNGYQIALAVNNQAGRCACCLSDARPEFTVQKPGDSQILFCSESCRTQFGVELGKA